MESDQPRERADVVLDLVRTVTRLEAARRLVPPYESEIAKLSDRRIDLLDELFALDARRA
jgi:hypothetical protein